LRARTVKKLERAEDKEHMMVRFDEEEPVARLLAYVTRMINQQLLLQNEYLLAENRILRAHLPSRLLLTDPERVLVNRSCHHRSAGLVSYHPRDTRASPTLE
jgi:hypothetical protein